MTSIQEFLSYLHTLDVKVWAEGESLRCNAPKGVLTAALREELASRKQAILEFLSQTNNQSTLIPSVERSSPLPLSFAQERLWFLDQLEGGHSNVYNMDAAVELVGKLNREAVRKAFQALIERHEILRTAIVTAEGQPQQAIAPEPHWQIQEIDLGQLEPESQAQQVRELIGQEAATPFDLSQSPLMRVQLLQLAAEHHILQITLHHIISDGWSMEVLVREWSGLYRAFVRGEPSPLPPLTIQYADFAVWQRRWLQGEVLQRQLDYWKKQLEDAPPLLELPTDYPRPAVQTFRGQTGDFYLSGELTQKLRALAQKAGATLFMTLFAALSVLLSRYSRQGDIVIGSPIANRHRQELEPLIGFFVNTLALRVRLADNPSFEELLGQVRQTTLEAYSHQDLPFEKLVEELQVERSLSHTPLFQVMFALQNTPPIQLQLPDLEMKVVEGESTVAKFDLTLTIEEREQGLQGSWEYNGDLFAPQTIERLTGHWQNLLGGIVVNPQAKISELPMLSAAERQQLLEEWNRTQRDYPRDKCIHHLFEEQVARTPEAVALVYEGQSLTYRELNQKANQLAHYLQGLGVRPETLVGICLERSLEMVIGLLAILKAGGAYVPLDPVYPEERLAYMLSDSGVSVLLTQEQWLARLPASTGRSVCLDRDGQTIAQESGSNPSSEVSPNNIAYVIYTSGSTGTPKGVMIEHNSLVNFAQAAVANYQLSARDNILQFASISFDAAAEEIYPALIGGGRISLRTQDMLDSPSRFFQCCQEWEITVLDLPTAYWHQMVGELKEKKTNLNLPQSLRLVIIGGEEVSGEAVKAWQELVKNGVPQLVNTYGPTEATVVATSSYLGRGQEDSSIATKLSIGRPLENTQIYILDKYLQPVPIGVAGELHIGGEGVARGYLNRPQLTQTKFIVHPFSNEPKARLYKTGDLCRYLADGNIEYLGRIDNQVKLRGFRIELGEIESLLGQEEGIREAAVILTQEEEGGNKKLVAYVVGNKVGSPELRQKLKSKLPEYMIPSQFVWLEALPLTPNGKIDRRALPAPVPEQRLTEILQPQTPTQEILSHIWAEILKVPQIGRTDNFFELGGHSLLATQMISRVRGSLGIELPLRSLFESPTLEQLAARIEQAYQDNISLKLTPIEPLSSRENLPLSFAQERLWFLDQLEEGHSSTYNMHSAVELVGKLNREAVRKAFHALIERHEILRTAIVTEEGQPQQAIAPEPQWQIQEIDLGRLEPESQARQVRELIGQEASTPFDLSQSPLMRVQLLQLAAECHILQITLHHIISDGWSMEVLVREWSALYRALSGGQPSPLAPLTIQYADFAVWQRQWLQGEVLQRQLDYWKKQLEDAPPLLELPTDHPRPAVQTFRGQTRDFYLSGELTEKLRALAQKAGATLFMTLFAALAILLSRYSRQEDIVIGSPIANRHRQELEPLIGFFVNTLALRVRLEDNPSFEELLGQVRQTTLEAYSHQDLPFEKLVEELQVERSLSHSPVFQVLFIWQNTPHIKLELPELELKAIEGESSVAKFDLTLILEESEQGLQGSWEYNRDLFEALTIERLTGHWQNLLEGIVFNPQAKISELPMLSVAEQQQLLGEWNRTQRDYPRDKCIHHLFEEQVARTPDALALVYEGQSLTYKQLNEKANQLAHYLQGLGVQPETLVGICVDRSPEMVIGLLAVLKAGGAYVPLDPTYPEERLAYILSDSQAKILLAESSWRDSQNFIGEGQIIVYLDKIFANLDEQFQTNLVASLQGKNLAYVIYTSGSTGQPKGVQICHQSLVNFMTSMQSRIGLDKKDILLAVTTISFDIAALEIYLPLIVGAKVVLVSKEKASDGFALSSTLIANQATVMQATPATWRLLLTADWPGGAGFKILCGGEAFSQKLANQLLSKGDVIWNLYGPTETTIWSTHYCLEKSSATSSGQDSFVSIGYPIDNTQIYILDKYLQPVPIGVAGELHIGGDGLARGYLNRLELTQERFILNPFSNDNDPKTLLYKTGDLCRYLADGKIEYLGRIDYQVKLRGFRIELGEIENTLIQHPGVQEAVVLLHDNLGDDAHLVAYLVTSSEQSFTNQEIRGFLQKTLPDYMIPRTYVFLKEMPLTPNGKLNRRALPAPDFAQNKSQVEFVAARTPTEMTLHSIFAEVLKLEQVGIYDNFFELGGNSLLATQVIARVRKSFQIDIPLRIIFDKSSIADLAEAIITQELSQVEETALDDILEEIDSLSDEEIQSLLTE